MSRSERFDELAEMEDGWYDGEGKAPTPQSITVARSFDAAFSGAHVYPTLEGGISLEGDGNGWSWNLIVGPRGGVQVVACDLTRFLSTEAAKPADPRKPVGDSMCAESSSSASAS